LVNLGCRCSCSRVSVGHTCSCARVSGSGLISRSISAFPGALTRGPLHPIAPGTVGGASLPRVLPPNGHQPAQRCSSTRHSSLEPRPWCLPRGHSSSRRRQAAALLHLLHPIARVSRAIRPSGAHTDRVRRCPLDTSVAQAFFQESLRIALQSLRSRSRPRRCALGSIVQHPPRSLHSPPGPAILLLS